MISKVLRCELQPQSDKEWSPRTRLEKRDSEGIDGQGLVQLVREDGASRPFSLSKSRKVHFWTKILGKSYVA